MKSNDELSIARNFGYCMIEWKIKNYFSATCMEDWIIASPTFSVNGKNSAKFRIYLNKETNSFKNRSTICASLTKVDKDAFQAPISVSWKLFLPGNMSRSELEVESDFESKRYIDIEICDARELEDIIQYSAEDMLIIRGVILARTKDNERCKRSKDLGLKSLSQDLTVLYTIDKNRDLKLLFGAFSAKAHKGILCYRNNVLKKAIERDDCVTILPELDMEAVENVFGYLYTGNLDYVLRKPSLAMIQCIQYFDIKEIEEYYKVDEVELCSEYKMEEYKVQCAIPVEQITYSNVIIHSFSILRDFSPFESVPIVQFSTESVNGMSGYISMFVDGMDESFQKTSYVELSVINVHGKTEYLRRKRSATKVAFENFLPRDILNDVAFTCDGRLHFLCSFCTPIANSRVLSAFNKKVYTDIFIDSENHYKMLSNQMSALFETALYSDFTLICEDERFRVHTSILSARSHVFKNMFKTIRTAGRVKSLEVSRTKSDVLRVVLYYIYSGKLPKVEVTEIFDIYEAAERFYLLPLKYTCSQILQDNVESLDIKRAFRLAETFKDYKLLSALKKFTNHKSSSCIQGVAKIDNK